MRKIQRFLIHLLGGITRKEHNDALDKKYRKGLYDMAENILSEMKRIYGTPVKEWAAHMYTSVSMRVEKPEIRAGVKGSC